MFLVLIAFVLVMTIGRRLAERPEVVPWRQDLSAAQAEAAAAGNKRVLLYFTAAWCGPCQEMKRTTWASTEVEAALARNYVPVRVDIDAAPDAAMRYGVMAIPVMMILDDEGRVTRRRDGYVSEPDILEWLKLGTEEVHPQPT